MGYLSNSDWFVHEGERDLTGTLSVVSSRPDVEAVADWLPFLCVFLRSPGCPEKLKLKAACSKME